ncbi:Uma2 family endonuclease [Cyanobacteria bacterium FACHB-DQ100]|uniref:Uma2 family endonuclease n=1 Tax=Leptolyngbya sp. DQ-M1 TaxID=2933920 RepID=UPI0019BE3F75|nr:Uma2 family endonuclease [Cyanobacteria bacterium FACHB-DQ100]
MTQAKSKFSSFEEYLAYDDDTDQLYELVDGELVALPPESGRNSQILMLIILAIAPLIDPRRIRVRGLELEVRGNPRNRFPDLTILHEEHIEQLQRRDTIRLSMRPPLLVIEIVSPGEANRARDYSDKRNQYQDRGIPEYWVVDPQTQAVTVLKLNESGIYIELGVFQNDQRIESLLFPEFNLTPAQMFAA